MHCDTAKWRAEARYFEKSFSRKISQKSRNYRQGAIFVFTCGETDNSSPQVLLKTYIMSMGTDQAKRSA